MPTIQKFARANSMRGLMGCFIPMPYVEPGDKYKAWKLRASWDFKAARDAYCGSRPFVAKGESVEVRMLYVSPLPKTSERKTEAKRPIRDWLISKAKGDPDNLMKGPLDAANGVIWHDDSQVASAQIEKVVGAQFEEPRLEIMIWKLERADAQQTEFERVRDSSQALGCLYAAAKTEEQQCQTERTGDLPF
jgi:Holliday junction resolvase RusA-like endonuclease